MSTHGPKRHSSFAGRTGVTGQGLRNTTNNSVKSRLHRFSTKTGTPSTEQRGKVGKNYDKDLEDKFRLMLRGKLDELPNLPRTIVRIFISSTFSDMRAERNILSREVFPKLKQFCLSKDLDFQVVDMRWGVTEDSQNDHSVEKICLQEVENCQQMSLGPNFVAIIGNRYGFRPIPTEIAEKDFKLLKSFVTEDVDAKLLDTWYKLDENCQPHQYVLQPISSQFSFFADFSPGCDGHRAKHAKEWNRTLSDLQRILRHAAQLAYHSKKFTEAQLHEYFYSVTEIEMRKGILSVDDPASQSAVFSRDITGFSDFDDAQTMRFIDTARKNGKNDVNSEVQRLQRDLTEKLTSKTKSRHTHKHTVIWQPQGINPEIYQEHALYLNEFCEEFYNDCIKMIDLALEKRRSQIRKREFRSKFPDVLHHLHFCRTKCRTFCGQDIVLRRMKEYILDVSMNKPLVVHAPSGNGKTSVLAMVMKNLRGWLTDENYIGIIRFLGTSGLSLNVYDVLVSLVRQLSDVSGIGMEPIGYKKMKNLLEYLPRFIRRVANSLKRPVIILLDSIDQLSGEHGAYNMKWLPLSLPQNVKIIVSTLPKEHGILENIKALLPDSNCYLEINDMPLDTGKEITENYLSMKNRSLTSIQEKVLMNAFSKCPSPLFLKLSIDEAMKWKSYTEEHNLVLQETVEGAINKLFENIEVKFGNVIASHALGYITIARDGISENELEDVLSCDDEALDDVYRYHNPPVDGIVRIPPVLVARIKYDIKEYIVERLSYDKYTMNWYHRQFTKVARARYTSGAQGELLHKNLVEIFMCETGVKRDIVLSRRKLTIPNADRQVTLQPISERNGRMLFCLPYHMINARKSLSLRQAKDKCLCNFNFIRFKIAAFSTDTFVNELNEFLLFQEDEELKALRDFLASSKKGLIYPNKLAVNLLEYVFVDSKDVSLQNLLNQAADFLRKQINTTLIPVYPGLAPRLGVSAAIINSYVDVDSIVSYGQEVVLVKDSSKTDEDDTVSPYKVYYESSQELIEVDVPYILEEEHQPIVDGNGHFVIFTSQDSVILTDLIENIKIQKQFQNLDNGVSSKRKIICKRVSTDTKHLVMLFDDGDIILLKINNLEVMNRWTLHGNVADVVDIVCTEHFTVLVISSDKDNNRCGVLQEYTKGTCVPNQYCFDFQLSSNCYGLSKGDCIFSVLDFKDEIWKMVRVNLHSKKIQAPIKLQDRFQRISCSNSTPLVCAWSDDNKVVVLDVEKGTPIFKITVSNRVTCAKISGREFTLLLGDNDGNIALYDARNGTLCTSVKADDCGIQQLIILDDVFISRSRNKMLVWSTKSLLEKLLKVADEGCFSSSQRLLDQQSITNISLPYGSHEFVTADKNGMLKVWKLRDGGFIKEFPINMVAKKILMCGNEICCVLGENKELKVFHLQKSEILEFGLPKDVYDVTVGKDLTTLYTLGMNGNFLHITIIDLKQKTIRKSFPIQSIVKFENLDICLSQSERYICLRLKVVPEEYENIKTLCEERSYLPQVHPHKFMAVDLQQATGGLMPCVRNFSPIPHLGEDICPHIGNSMIINNRHWVTFWDIPTGKCRRRAKDKEQSSTRRQWFENFKEFKGCSKALAQSKDGRIMALGMLSGYVFLFDVVTAYPVGEKLPITKHAAPVLKVVFSPDSRWLASACQHNKIKMWDTSNSSEVFSTSVDGNVLEMKFSSDSVHLLILSGRQFSRILIYRVHTDESGSLISGVKN
ncbi:uncharacterized protein LOC125672012 [Ostrea edulis]|uniref:uncharacterized protein LOC125672012 n=1 Tax=Ostrea edulis TaxID=37623 RepID=UPI0024AF11DD|nr:uncharacterized protein LOC125672012 [Ostrea edulis]